MPNARYELAPSGWGFVQPEITQTKLQMQETALFYASDGLWSVIEDHEFAEQSDQTRIPILLLKTWSIWRSNAERMTIARSLPSISTDFVIKPLKNRRKERGWLGFFT